MTNFLMIPNTKSIKKEIRNICGSYSHPWDVLAELSQNSVDAIKKWNLIYPDTKKQHKIDIVIDSKRKVIEISDTGVGFDVDKAAELLGPNSTDKDVEETTAGEKGVGLTFCIFISNIFIIHTRSVEGEYIGEIKLARNWRDNDKYDVEDMPELKDKITKNKYKPGDTFTKIILEDIDLGDMIGDNIFDLTLERMIYLLRTKTAIGNTHSKKGTEFDLNIDVNLKYINVDGKGFDQKIDFEYFYPHYFWKSSDVINIEEFEKKAGARMTDSKKRKKLSGKQWIVEGNISHKGRDIHYYGLFVQSREDYKTVCQQNKLGSINEQGELFERDFSGGIYVATKNMPTGLQLSPPPGVGEAAYFPLLYLLLEYDGFTFDIGRKYIPGPTQVMLREIAKQKYYDFLHWKKFLRGGSKSPLTRSQEISSMDRIMEFKEINRLPNINYDEIAYLKVPAEQEAAVVAIFHELVGKQMLYPYRCMKTGHKQQYDFWGKYQIDKSAIGEKIQKQIKKENIDLAIVIEFKYDCADIIYDVERERKHFEDINLIICWKIDRDKFAEQGISVEPIPDDEVMFYGSNYYLEWPDHANLGKHSQKPVLELREFIDKLKLK